MIILNKNADFEEVKDFEEMGAPPIPSPREGLKNRKCGKFRRNQTCQV